MQSKLYELSFLIPLIGTQKIEPRSPQAIRIGNGSFKTVPSSSHSSTETSFT